MAAFTQEDILTFLLDHGGKVKNSDLLNYFRRQINSGGDPAEKQHNRDVFKKFVNSVAVVKQVDGVKFVVVRKRYRDFVKGGTTISGESDDIGRQKTTLISSTGGMEERNAPRREFQKMLYSDFENNNVYCASNINGNYLGDNIKGIGLHDSDKIKAGIHSSCNLNSEDATTVKVVNICSDQTSCRTRRSGAVFAVIAVKSPPRPTSTERTDPVLVDMTQEGLNPPRPQPKTQEKLNMIMAPKAPLEASAPVMDVKCLVSEQDEWNSSYMWSKNRQIEPETEMQEAASSPQLKRPQNKTTKQGDDAKDSESVVPLEPIAHEWLVKSATGLWGQLYGLLLQDNQLARKKDFMSGFTALHWAAKAGNTDMVHKIMAISKKRGAFVDINSKTHGGYTPLHIATIHGHHEVMQLLVQSYGAKVNIRDNDGKKPYHYLDGSVSLELKDLLGWSQPLQQQDRDRVEHELPKGLNTISKLFQPHMGHRKKHRQQTNLSTC